MKVRKGILFCMAFLCVFVSLRAEGLSRDRRAVKVSGDVLMVAMPVATAATVLAMKDCIEVKEWMESNPK